MGYRLNRLDEPVFMAVPKLMLTEFGMSSKSCEENLEPVGLVNTWSMDWVLWIVDRRWMVGVRWTRLIGYKTPTPLNPICCGCGVAGDVDAIVFTI